MQLLIARTGKFAVHHFGLLKTEWKLASLVICTTIALAGLEGSSIAMLIPLLGSDQNQFGANNPIGMMIQPFLSMPPQERVLLAAIALAVITVMRSLVQFASQYLSAMLPLYLERRLRRENFRHLVWAELPFLMSRDVGQMSNQLNQYPSMVARSTRALLDAGINGILVLVYLSIMVMVSADMALASLVSLAAVMVLLKLINVRYLIPAGHTVGSCFEAAARVFQESVLGMKLIRLRAAEERMTERYEATLEGLHRSYRTMSIVQEIQAPVSNGLTGLVICAILAIGVTRHVGPVQDFIAQIIVFIACLYRLLGPASKIINCQGVILMNAHAQEKIEEFCAEAQANRFRTGEAQFSDLQSDLRIENLSFTYQGETAPALDNVSLDIKRGETVALVGHSGSGKSTIVGLLTGLFRQQQGHILVDGLPLDQYDIRSWRKRLAVVSQDVVLFNDTVRGNLEFGMAGVSDEELAAAARFAAASEFIEQLPEGFDTPLGDRGLRLSGGQQQRLALARAVLVKPSLLILDEATSQLDSITESSIQKAIDEFARHSTVIIVAHRLSTVRRADKIVVMEKGRCVEEGTHEELLRRNGLYKELLRHQELRAD